MKKCLIYANCQGPGLLKLLRQSAEFDNEFQTNCFHNFRKEVPSRQELSQCDLFIYQQLSERWEDAGTTELMRQLPAQCVRFRMPKFRFKPFWPFFCPNPYSKPEPDFPHGRYFYGDAKLFELMSSPTTDAESVAEQYESMDLAKTLDLDGLLAETVLYYQKEHNALDYDFSVVLKRHLSDMRLFRSFNHPTNSVLIDIGNEILSRIGLTRLTDKDISHLKDLGQDNTIPVHPSIIRHFGIQHLETNERYCVNGKLNTFKEYTRNFVNHALMQGAPHAA